MKRLFIFYLLCSTVLFNYCTQKKGVDELVFLSDVNRASDEVYIDFLTKGIDHNPKGADKYLKLAEIYKRKGNSEEAILLLQKADEENPYNVDILIGLSLLYLENRDAKALSSTLNEIRKIDPDNLDFLKLSAGYFLLEKDYTNSMFFANRAMLINPFDDEIKYLRGSAMLINLDSINALDSYEDAYNLKSSYKNFAAFFDLAVILNKPDIAKKYLDDFESNNSDVELCYEKGVYFHESGKLDTAKMILKSCFVNGTVEPRTNFELARIYFDKNDTDSAEYYINLFLNEKPEQTLGYILKGSIMEKSNNYSDAKKFYMTAIEMDSTDRLAVSRLENLERKVAYLQLIKRKEDVQRPVETLKPLNSKVIN